MRFLALAVIALIAAACSSGERSSGVEVEPTSSEQRPAFAYVRNDAELFVELDSGEVERLWELDDESQGNGLVVESIEPVSAQQVFIGVCCEPTNGRQLLVDLSTRSVEVFPLTVRFPSVGEDTNSVVSGGSSIVADNLGAFLAYENGVGVVNRGSTIRPASDGAMYQPHVLPNERVVFTTGTGLVATDFDGEIVAEATLGQIVEVDYDEWNNVVVALVDGTEETAIVLLAPDTLDEAFRWSTTTEFSMLDARDGWLILTRIDGAIEAVPLDDLDAVTTVVDAEATTAAWLR